MALDLLFAVFSNPILFALLIDCKELRHKDILQTCSAGIRESGDVGGFNSPQ